LREERFEALTAALVDAADAADIGVLVVNQRPPTPTIVFASHAAARLLGRPRDQLVGSCATSLVVPLGAQGAQPDQSEEASAADWELSRFETTFDRADGQRVTVEVSCCMEQVDGQRLVAAFLVDVSSRKHVESALLRSERRFKRLIEGAPEAVLITAEGRIAFANPMTAELFGGVGLAELLGRDLREYLHPDDVPKFEQRLQTIVREGRRLPPTEYRFLRPTGEPVVLEFSSIAIEYEGRPAVLSLARDVTERKQLESQLMQADRLGALGMLAGGMAHAINNPLTYVLLNLDDVARRLPEVPSGRSSLPEALARLKEAHQGAERVAGIVRQMRAFSRPDERVRGPVDLRRALEAALAMVGNEIRHRARLVVEFADVPPVQATSARLEHVFLNLLLHVAQQLTEGDPDNEIRLALRSDPPGRVVVEVSQRGPTLEPAQLDRLFDPFFAGDVDSGRVGLGLSLCHGIVTALGGSMVVESRAGLGTTFRVSLPADVDAAEVPASSRVYGTRAPLVPSRRARVMVVDDDPGVVNALRLMLEDDHDVTAVSSGPEALRMLVREDAYDVVFCDLVMPQVSGKDLYEALQLNCPGRERRLVFMTGGAFTREAARFIKQVPNPRIEKPFDMDSVKALLEYAVQRGG
jgi:two-component system cell cycle sensor histidine kinase/response regulator CckA